MMRSSRFLPALSGLLVPLALLPSQAALAACEPVTEALVRLAQTPSHQYTTSSLPGLDTKPSEVVITGATMWLLVDGRWRSLPYDARKRIAEMKRSTAEASAAARGSCARVRHEAGGGEPATLYKVHDATDAGIVDSQIWISAAHGLALHQVVDMLETDSYLDSRFDYANVRPPATH
jgi:hypothetical protein